MVLILQEFLFGEFLVLIGVSGRHQTPRLSLVSVISWCQPFLEFFFAENTVLVFVQICGEVVLLDLNSG